MRSLLIIITLTAISFVHASSSPPPPSYLYYKFMSHLRGYTPSQEHYEQLYPPPFAPSLIHSLYHLRKTQIPQDAIGRVLNVHRGPISRHEAYMRRYIPEKDRESVRASVDDFQRKNPGTHIEAKTFVAKGSASYYVNGIKEQHDIHDGNVSHHLVNIGDHCPVYKGYGTDELENWNATPPMEGQQCIHLQIYPRKTPADKGWSWQHDM